MTDSAPRTLRAQDLLRAIEAQRQHWYGDNGIVEIPRALFDWLVDGQRDRLRLVSALRNLLVASEGLVRASETFNGFPALESAWTVAKGIYDEIGDHAVPVVSDNTD